MTDVPAHRTFSPADAALEGFRIMRESSRTMLIWGLVNFAVSVVLSVLLILLFGDVLAELDSVKGLPTDSPEVQAAVARAVPMYAAMLPAYLLIVAVFSAAVFRLVLRPQDRSRAYLRLGGDELRLAFLTLIYFGLSIVLVVVVTLAALVLGEVAAAMGEAVAALAGVVITIGALSLMVFVAVRMSLAGPMTFAEGRLRVFESWKLTRGYFWRLFGAYVLAIMLMLIVFLLALVIYVAVATIIAGGNLSSAASLIEPSPTSVADFLTPIMALWMVFVAFLSVVQNAVLYAPPAVAYRALSGTEEGYHDA